MEEEEEVPSLDLFVWRETDCMHDVVSPVMSIYLFGDISVCLRRNYLMELSTNLLDNDQC